jgi:hypothetical protein
VGDAGLNERGGGVVADVGCQTAETTRWFFCQVQTLGRVGAACFQIASRLREV